MNKLQLYHKLLHQLIQSISELIKKIIKKMKILLKNSQNEPLYPQTTSDSLVDNTLINANDYSSLYSNSPDKGKLLDNWKNMLFGKLNVSGNTVSTEVFNIPTSRCKVRFKVPLDISWIIRYGYTDGASWTADHFTSNSYQGKGSKEFIFPPTIRGGKDTFSDNTGDSDIDKELCYFKIEFNNVSDTSVFLKKIASGEISVTYYDPSGGVVARNPLATMAIGAAQLYGTNKILKPRYRNDLFIHISDTHGNIVALKDCYEYAEYIGAKGIFITGDVVAQSSYNSMDYVTKALSVPKDIPIFVTTGNHDGVGTSIAEVRTNLIDKVNKCNSVTNYVFPSADVCYYYQDLPTQKIRVIVLDCSDSSADYRISSIGNTQIAWLKTTLSSVPSGYGVVIAEHQFLGVPSSDFIKNNSEFVDPNRDGTGTWTYTDGTGFSEVRSAVDNFITNGGEFIMYMNGHNHCDIVGPISNATNTQLQANIANASLPLDMNGDIVSHFDGRCDCFNVYAFNRIEHKVVVVRVGNYFTRNFTRRLYSIYDYK